MTAVCSVVAAAAQKERCAAPMCRLTHGGCTSARRPHLMRAGPVCRRWSPRRLVPGACRDRQAAIASLTLEAFVFEAGRGSMAEKVEFPPRLRVCPECPGEMGFSKWPTKVCDHRCVPPVRPGGRSSGDLEAFGGTKDRRPDDAERPALASSAPCPRRTRDRRGPLDRLADRCRLSRVAGRRASAAMGRGRPSGNAAGERVRSGWPSRTVRP
jgi:hypothetical protein